MITKFHASTPQAVKDILQSYCHTGKRLRLFYGDTDRPDFESVHHRKAEPGKDWGEENDMIGMIGNSTGPQCIPIMLANSRSMGGEAILDDCIVRIIDCQSKRELYRHPQYHQPEYTVKKPPLVIGKVNMADNGYNVGVYANGDNVANFKSLASARHWVEFMTGKRMSK